MNGARKYYDIFGGRSQQIGRLFFQLHTHARGKCFEIILLPEGRVEKGSRLGSTKDTVKVYGMVSGQRGWTETYGWIHGGKWQEDFKVILEEKIAEQEKRKSARKLAAEKSESKENARTRSLLNSY